MITKRENVLNIKAQDGVSVKEQNVDMSTAKPQTNTIEKGKNDFSFNTYNIGGKSKKKLFLNLIVNADVWESAKAIFGDIKAKDLINSALMNCVKLNDEKAFDALVKKIKDGGGEL